MENKSVNRRKGFTLLELAIVGIFLGLLALFAVSTMRGDATLTTKARVMEASTRAIADGWRLLALSCGVSRDIGVSRLSDRVVLNPQEIAGVNIAVLAGVEPIKAEYTACYKAAGLKPLGGVRVTWESPVGKSGNWSSEVATVRLNDRGWSTSTVEVASTSSGVMKVKFVDISVDLAKRAHLLFSGDPNAKTNVNSPFFTTYVNAVTGYEYRANSAMGSVTLTEAI